MLILYSQVFANGCHNSCIDAETHAEGTLAWERKICREPGEIIEARLLITADDIVIVEGIQSICVFDSTGKSLWTRSKWYGTPVVLREGLIFFTTAKRKTRMEAVDLNNEIQLRDFWIPNVGEYSYLEFFAPYENGLIAQVRFTEGPSYQEEGFIIYNIRKGGLGFEWSKSYVGETPIYPAISWKGNFLVTALNNEVLVFDLENHEREPEPTSRFPFPLGDETHWMSCGQDGSLYWAGLRDDSAALTVTDREGIEKWSWQPAASERPSTKGPLMPVLITPTLKFLITSDRLYALDQGSLAWAVEAEKESFLTATALSDGSVLIVAGNRLRHIDAQGKERFEVKFEEPIVTPPVVDLSGQIYVAGKEILYAIK